MTEPSAYTAEELEAIDTAYQETRRHMHSALGYVRHQNFIVETAERELDDAMKKSEKADQQLRASQTLQSAMESQYPWLKERWKNDVYDPARDYSDGPRQSATAQVPSRTVSE